MKRTKIAENWECTIVDYGFNTMEFRYYKIIRPHNTFFRTKLKPTYRTYVDLDYLKENYNSMSSALMGELIGCLLNETQRKIEEAETHHFFNT